MKRILIAALAATTAISSVAAAGGAAAQPGYYGQDRYRDSDRDGRPDYREWNRDRDRDGRPDQYDRYDNRRDGRYYGDHRYRYDGDRNYRYYGGQYGYNGYQGRWREGHRYPYYRDSHYYIQDYRAYRLPPPRPGYRYYRDNNGDVLMVAIASGIIGLIIGGALNDNDGHYHYGR